MVFPVQQFNELPVVYLVSTVGLTTACTSAAALCVTLVLHKSWQWINSSLMVQAFWDWFEIIPKV